AAVSADADLVGLGMTPMSLRPGATPLELAVEASAAALSDAGLGRADVDGILVGSSQGVRPDRLGVGFTAAAGFSDLRLLEHVEIKGATTVAMIQRARHAIVTGEASTVLCVFADAPLVAGRRAGSAYAPSGGDARGRGLERASGLLGSVPTYALLAQRWLHVTGTSADALRSVATTARRWARDNPDAVNREPLDDADYDSSPMIAEPLRLLDCARPVNGAVAVVLTGRASVGANRLRILGTGRDHPTRR